MKPINPQEDNHIKPSLAPERYWKHPAPALPMEDFPTITSKKQETDTTTATSTLTPVPTRDELQALEDRLTKKIEAINISNEKTPVAEQKPLSFNREALQALEDKLAAQIEALILSAPMKASQTHQADIQALETKLASRIEALNGKMTIQMAALNMAMITMSTDIRNEMNHMITTLTSKAIENINLLMELQLNLMNNNANKI
eukprot:2511789-Ditylum_brightwellii.AAC.1